MTAKELNARIRTVYGDPESFLEQIRSLMEKYRVTQAQMCRVSGASPSHMSKWLSKKETSHVSPGLETRMMLAETLEEILLATKAPSSDS